MAGPADKPPAWWWGARVLVVDDDDGVRVALERMLRRFAVTAVATVDEAVRSWDATPFELVLCDVSMPDGGAVALHHIVTERWPLRLQKLVLMSGIPLVERQLARLGPAPPTLLHKPFDLGRVVEAYERVSRAATDEA